MPYGDAAVPEFLFFFLLCGAGAGAALDRTSFFFSISTLEHRTSTTKSSTKKGRLSLRLTGKQEMGQSFHWNLV